MGDKENYLSFYALFLWTVFEEKSFIYICIYIFFCQDCQLFAIATANPKNNTLF